MASERTKRQLDRLLDEAEEAITEEDWSTVASRARAVLRLDPGNGDALGYLAAAERDQAIPDQPSSSQPTTSTPAATAPAALDQPTSFSNGRYQVKRFLGEGGKKKVYLATDTLLDREVALALIKTEGLHLLQQA